MAFDAAAVERDEADRLGIQSAREGWPASNKMPPTKVSNMDRIIKTSRGTFDLGKPLFARDGQAIEIRFSNGRGDYPFVGYVADSDVPMYWRADFAAKTHVDRHPIDVMPNVERKKCRVALLGCMTLSADNDESARDMEGHESFTRWLTDWIEYDE